MYDAFLYELEQENKEIPVSNKGNQVKKLIDKIEYLETYRLKEIELHKEFLDDMINTREAIIKLNKELKVLMES